MRSLMLLLVLAMLVGRASADDVTGVVVDHGRVVPHAIVRIVGAGVVVIARTDARGHFRVTGMPVGTYRYEVERGFVVDREAAPLPTMQIDRDDFICILPGPGHFEAVLGVAAGTQNDPPPLPNGKPRGFVDTTSSALETHLVFFGH